MPKTLTIRNMPDDLYATLKARAAAAGVSLSEYLRWTLDDIAVAPAFYDRLHDQLGDDSDHDG